LKSLKINIKYDYNPDRYIYLVFRREKDNATLKIWKDLQTKSTQADLKIESDEYRNWKHISIKKLINILEEIEKTGKIPL